MSADRAWIIPDLVKRHGIHVLSGPGVRKFARALHARLTKAGHALTLIEPHSGLTQVGAVWPLNDLRRAGAVLIVAPQRWQLQTLQLVELTADVVLHMQDNWTLH